MTVKDFLRVSLICLIAALLFVGEIYLIRDIVEFLK